MIHSNDYEDNDYKKRFMTSKVHEKPIYVEIRLKRVITKADHHEDKVLPIFPLSITSTVEEEKENYPSYHHKNNEDN